MTTLSFPLVSPSVIEGSDALAPTSPSKGAEYATKVSFDPPGSMFSLPFKSVMPLVLLDAALAPPKSESQWSTRNTRVYHCPLSGDETATQALGWVLDDFVGDVMSWSRSEGLTWLISVCPLLHLSSWHLIVLMDVCQSRDGDMRTSIRDEAKDLISSLWTETQSTMVTPRVHYSVLPALLLLTSIRPRSFQS